MQSLGRTGEKVVPRVDIGTPATCHLPGDYAHLGMGTRVRHYPLPVQVIFNLNHQEHPSWEDNTRTDALDKWGTI